MSDNVSDKFKGLPIKDLIGLPLAAACEAQVDLASAAFDFMMKIGFDDKECKNARLIQFNLTRPVETPTGIEENSITVQAPFLGLVPIPSLLVENVEIDFQMEVTATEVTKTKLDAEVTTKAVFNPWFSRSSVEVQGRVTTSRENTRSTNQTAKYQIHVSARQQPPTEGLSRLMDIMATCTAPLKTSGQ